MKHSLFTGRILTGFALAALLAAPAMAAEDVYCFSQADFQAEDAYGVMLTQVPAQSQGRLMLGDRALRAGDALTADRLQAVTFVPAGDGADSAVISCLRLDGDGASPYQVTLKLGREKNEPPTAEDSTFTTYKNIPGQVPLTASDPEGEPLTVNIVKAPKRGDVTLGEDGSLTYTPGENKVGKDSFVYTVTDPAGNVSEEATVRIEIRKPSDKQTYGDMTGDPAELAAVWLREEGIFSGETVSGTLLFQPERTVTRGEFLAMCAGLLGQGGSQEVLETGFSDGAETPAWVKPHVTTALRCGYLSGIPSADGLLLDAAGDVTQAQAVKLVSGLLDLPRPETEAVMGTDSAMPAWAAAPASAMAEAELFEMTEPNAALTRREAAEMLYEASLYGQERGQEASLLAWAAK